MGSTRASLPQKISQNFFIKIYIAIAEVKKGEVMEEIILKTEGLTKIYGGIHAVKNVDMTIHKGDIYGFVGPNGSGKTTFMRMITSLSHASSGTFSLFGSSCKTNAASLSRVSCIIEGPAIYQHLSACDNLKIQCGIVGITAVAREKVILDLLKLVDLSDAGKKKSGNFSLGMRTRLGIAMALVGKPDFMILDEPTNGLDPQGIAEIRKLLLDLNAKLGITILISSHILGELEKLATRYGFIKKGKLCGEISVDELAALGEGKTQIKVSDIENAVRALVQNSIVHTIVDDSIMIDGIITISELAKIMNEFDVEIISCQSQKMDLETYYLSLMQGGKGNE